MTTPGGSDVLRQLSSRLGSGDTAWIRKQLNSGNLNALKNQVPESTWKKFSDTANAGDISGMRQSLAGVTVPGVGNLVDDSTIVRDDVTTRTSNVDDEVRARARRVEEPVREVDYVEATADRGGGGGWWKWLLPVGALAVGLAVAIPLIASNVGDDDDDDDSSSASAPTIADPSDTDSETPGAGGGALATPSGTAGSSGTAGASGTPGASGGVVDTLESAGGYTVFVGLLDQSGVADTLDSGTYTIFAPTDEAFATLSAEQMAALEADQGALEQVMEYHVVSGEMASADLTTGAVPTLQGTPVNVVADGATITVNGATVTSADVESENGVIHEIDAVLIPPNGSTAQSTPQP